MTESSHWILDSLREEYGTRGAGKSGLSSYYEVLNLLVCRLI